MRRSCKLASVAVVSVFGAGCHKKTVTATPPVPTQAQQAPAASHPRTNQPAPQPQPQQAQQPQPEFRLGQALSPEDLRANNALIDRHLQHATQALTLIGNRKLTNDQKSSVAQIRGFIDQSREMRGTDVLRARSLAERADVLAQDLLSRLK